MLGCSKKAYSYTSSTAVRVKTSDGVVWHSNETLITLTAVVDSVSGTNVMLGYFEKAYGFSSSTAVRVKTADRVVSPYSQSIPLIFGLIV